MKRRYPPANVVAKRRRCVDCADEGVTTTRKAPHPGPRCATHHRVKRNLRSTATWEQRLQAKYNLTAEEYWQIYEHQEGFCFICRRAFGKTKKLSVDHCHASGQVRGLLCFGCNRNVLGHLRDEPEALRRAAEYLEKPPAIQVIGIRITPN